MDAEYNYEPLGPGQIRLLHLKPGTGHIHFTLQPANLNQEPEYEAISYCWGPLTHTRTVYCEDKPLQVTNSLFTALEQLRLLDRPRTLWADAVCINQKDVFERSSQVKLMNQIYAKPTRVVIWLGEDTTGLDGIEECISTALRILPPMAFDGQEIQQTCQKVFREASKLRAEGKPNFNDHDWEPINNLLCRPWFERKWVIQEVVMAEDRVPRLIICGHFQLSWADLASIAYRLSSYGILTSVSGFSVINSLAPKMASFLTDQGRPIRMINNVSMMMLIKHYGPEATLVDCLVASMWFKCTKDLDHIYAILSLCALGARPTPDYDVSMEELCKLFAIKTLIADQNMKVLSLATCRPSIPGNEPTERLYLPSWIPDLTAQGTVNPLVSYTIRSQRFHAGGIHNSSARVSQNGRFLHLRGRLIDTVRATTKRLVDMPVPSDADIEPKKGFSTKLKMWKRNWLKECRDLAADGDWTSLSPAQRRAFARTMMCDMTGMRDPIPEEVISSIELYMDYLFGFFTADFVLTEHVRNMLLTHGGIIEHSLMSMAANLRFCVTENQRFGQVQQEASVGDLCCVFLGAEVPYVLRRTGMGTYKLIGECFLFGIMEGEAFSDDRYETIDIVLE